MSGSSNNYSDYSPVSKDCTALKIRTKLASPDRKVIDTINIGDVLKVVLSPPAGPVNIMTDDDQIAGAVLPMNLDTLVECISDGHEFEAKVLEINMGNCEIQITHK